MDGHLLLITVRWSSVSENLQVPGLCRGRCLCEIDGMNHASHTS